MLVRVDIIKSIYSFWKLVAIIKLIQCYYEFCLSKYIFDEVFTL